VINVDEIVQKKEIQIISEKKQTKKKEKKEIEEKKEKKKKIEENKKEKVKKRKRKSDDYDDEDSDFDETNTDEYKSMKIYESPSRRSTRQNNLISPQNTTEYRYTYQFKKENMFKPYFQKIQG
jgi:hypothetical protein